MKKCRSVAIIGAGPSGLTAAKSFLHDHGPDLFRPVIFEKMSDLGGLWPTSAQDHTKYAAPDLRTNASKHVVAFSDLAWSSVPSLKTRDPGQDFATFPEAYEVGQYLQTYADRFIPREMIRFNREVTRVWRTASDSSSCWSVSSRRLDGLNTVVTEHFDHVVVASGIFGSMRVPKITGLDEFPGPIVHTSRLHEAEKLLPKLKPKSKIVVVGCSISGADAAALLSFHLSSARYRPKNPVSEKQQPVIYNICSRPFWALPLLVPVDPVVNGKPNPQPSFLPLDLALSDLGRRSGDLRQAAPIATFTPDSAKKINELFASMMGSDQSEIGNGVLAYPEELWEKPPWLVLGDQFYEFVRSQDITVIRGRATKVQGAGLLITESDGKEVLIEDVSMLVLATGYSPHGSLASLDNEVKRLLEFDENNFFTPIKLSNYSTMNPNVPGLGFVGYYRAPFFGTIELQARFLSALWAGHLDKEPCVPPAEIGTPADRGQFSMNDYAGLMESLSGLTGTRRQPLSELSSFDTGPAIPARYADVSKLKNPEALRDNEKLCKSALEAVSERLFYVSPAVFRAIQGKWRLQREINSKINTYPCGTFTGDAYLYPRQPTGEGYSGEMLYRESGELLTQAGIRMQGSRSYVYRITESEPQRMSAWFVKPDSNSTEVDYHFHDIESPDSEDEENDAGWGLGWRGKGSHHLCGKDHYDTAYWFEFRGMEVRSWGIGYTVKGPNKDYETRATYTR